MDEKAKEMIEQIKNADDLIQLMIDGGCKDRKCSECSLEEKCNSFAEYVRELEE